MAGVLFRVDIIEVSRFLRFGTEVAIDIRKALDYINLCITKMLEVKNTICIGGEKRVNPSKFIGRRERRRAFSSEGFKTMAQGQILA